jgi:putative endopeptidase
MYPVLLVFLIPGCINQNKSSRNETNPRDILTANRDTTVDPSQNFFMYANGGWIKANPIPGDQSSWGIGHAVQEEIYLRLRSINEQAPTAPSGLEQKIGAFWASAMDTVSIEKQKLDPIAPELKAIDGIRDLKTLAHVVADFHSKGIGGLYNDAVYQDAKKSDVMAYYLSQGGLGLPNRDYYFNTDARTQKIRTAYSVFVADMFRLLGDDAETAKRKSEEHIKMETRLAQSSRKLEALRDDYANYHKYAIKDLYKLAPVIDWPGMLARKGVKNIDSVIVGQPEFYQELGKSLASFPIESWKDYLRFHLLRSTASYLDSATYHTYFKFYGTTIRGIEKPKVRWKRMLDLQDGLMGEALGRVFVKEYFNEKAKKRYSDLVEEVRTELAAHIKTLDWMTDSTKQKALHKLSVMKKKVGYPDKWKDFSAMQIERGPLVRNVLQANAWWNRYEINKLGKPVDRDEWDMNPQTYNAYYNPSNNEIVLPAGIFTVPGFRDEELDDALVYGYAGATTIGHEITHGFDDQGRKYDAYGNLNAWWSEKDSVEFTRRAQVMIKQFNDYVVVDSMHINGEATIGENIADLGGAILALDAFKKTKTYKEGKLINGQTPLQRFFLGYSLGWLNHTRKETLADMVMTDVHSPAQWRVNGPFVNVDEFYEAFPIKAGSPMYRPDSLRVRIW